MTRAGCLRTDGTCRATGEGLCQQCARIQRCWSDPEFRVRASRHAQRQAEMGGPERNAKISAASILRRPIVDAKRKTVERLWRSGASDERIAKASGYKASSVHSIANTIGLRASDRKRRK